VFLLQPYTCDLWDPVVIWLVRFFQVLDLAAMEKSRHWQIVGCSAYTGHGLLQGFDWLVQDVASRIYVLD